MTAAAVPWRRLTWVTWRQHRTALTWALGTLALTAAGLAVTGVLVHDAAARHRYFSLMGEPWAGYVQIGVALSLIMPVLAGVFHGAPLIAREAETGTIQLAWTQGASRTRWLLAQVVPVAVLLAIAAAAVQLEFGWLPGLRAVLDQFAWSPEAFTLHPLPLAGWTTLAFSLGVLLGAVIGRTVPAIAATAACATGLWGAAGFWRAFYLPPVHRALPVRFIASGGFSWPSPPGPKPYVVSGGLGLPDGRLLSEAQLAQHTDSWLRLHHVVMWYSYQPASRYSLFQLIEFGWLGVLSAALIAATVLLIRRRAA